MTILNRRQFLRASGITMALPWLESLPAAGEGPPLRYLCVFHPNGVYPSAWDIEETGSDYQFSELLRPLEAHRRDLLILSNLNSTGFGHIPAISSFLTGVSGQGPKGIYAAPSLDQQLARAIGHKTLLPSIHLGLDPPGQGFNMGAPVSVGNTISWSSPTTRVMPEINPASAFDAMFRDRTSPNARDRATRHQSMIDAVLEDAKSLQRRASNRDREKINEYLESVRGVERRIERTLNPPENKWEPPSRPDLSRPDGIPRNRPDHLRLMMDLAVLAFQTDTTRIGTLITANSVSDAKLTFLDGVTEPHHASSHHAEKPAKIAQYKSITKWYIQQFGYLLDHMKAVDEGHGSLLDNTIVMWGSCIKNGNEHNTDHLPILMAGGRNAGLNPGRHLRLAEATPIASLHLTVAHRLGLPLESFNGVASATLEL